MVGHARGQRDGGSSMSVDYRRSQGAVSSGTLPFIDPTDRRVETLDLQRVRTELDLGQRLSSAPLQAHVRGFLFRQTADEVERSRTGAVVAYRRLSQTRSPWAFRMYSLREYLEDLAAAAAVIAPDDPAHAIRAIWRNGPRYAPLFNAARFLGLLGSDVLSAVRWLETHRNFFADYGRWRLETRTNRYFVMHYFDELISDRQCAPRRHGGAAPGVRGQGHGGCRHRLFLQRSLARSLASALNSTRVARVWSPPVGASCAVVAA